MAEAISGSASASEAVKKLLDSGRLRSTSETDMATLPLLMVALIRSTHADTPRRTAEAVAYHGGQGAPRR
ncbi:hypothetical protein BLTE_21190 [Blastochloris tepida]|uniref:Uncharacterized protein n=1 Tax=Blastochloris tepida TaxID=2233851 RepID=A0A348G1K1_9HYPH|nr:hypothetical protein BLTE_21190 [Blastochloris tepida]